MYCHRMLSALLDILAPPRSLTDRPGAWVTAEERAVLRASHPVFLAHHRLVQMGAPALDGLAAAGTYGGSVLLRVAIRRYKYHNVRVLSDELGAMSAGASHLLPPLDDVVLCPVPLHWSRRFERGWNQAQVLASAVADARGWPVAPLIGRARSTGAQAKRSHKVRRDAVRDAFIARLSPPRFVILVDDVCTTGATLDACASVLKAAGAQKVYGLVVALG